MIKMHIIEDNEPVEGFNQRGSEETFLEKAFKEGYECGYKKAMRETEGYSERKADYKESFEDRMTRLRNKYR